MQFSVNLIALTDTQASPDDTIYVLGPKTIDTFKGRLDKYWGCREVLYNQETEFCTGTGEKKLFVKEDDCVYLSD